ncbi:MAG: PPOX class F420-dependent oxidoreductase [Ornithinimicrobium sp.]
MSHMSIVDEKYIAFTTFRRSGDDVTTPVWVAPLAGGRAGFTTSASSGKAKRLAHTSQVLLQPCDQRGRIKGETRRVNGEAHVALPGDPEFDEVVAAIKTKYGWAATAISVGRRVMQAVRRSATGGPPDAVVVIELPEDAL